MSKASAVDAALRGLKLDDKVAALILNLCEQDLDAITAICRMIGAISYIAKGMNDIDRCGCAETLRSASDDIEHLPQPSIG
jgi:hypothetical protein